jgi:hypothetical protein
VAKIDVEHRKTTPPWLWIVVALIAILVILGLWLALSDDDDTPIDDPFAEEHVENGRTDEDAPSEVQDLGAFVQEADDRYEMGLEHQYTNEGFHSLADAIDAVAARRDVEDETSALSDSIRARADRLQNDEEAERHANLSREAATAGADAIEQLQQHYADAGADVSAVRSAANNINPQTLLLDQRTAIRDYFERAHRALDQMSRHGGQQRQDDSGDTRR